ncbi:putative nitrilase [Calycina marina]|uniref:Nitrilase n=1 Tax=Calycina marina TaxID=1763456 RepID=A0A9P8CE94_9HELO|nr:putative nitrilase [Calycina marina]
MSKQRPFVLQPYRGPQCLPSVEKLKKVTTEAALAGAKLVMFPVHVDKYYNSAAAVSSPELDVLRDAAQKKVMLPAGIIQEGGGILYCSTVLNSRNCMEKYMPAARLGLYQLCIELFAVLDSFDAADSQRGTLLHDIGEPVLQSLWLPVDYPPFTTYHHDRSPLGEKRIEANIMNHGGSCIVGPLKTIIAEPIWDREEIIYATSNLRDLTEARMDFDPVGSYSRPDVHTLNVNKKLVVSVSFSE